MVAVTKKSELEVAISDVGTLLASFLPEKDTVRQSRVLDNASPRTDTVALPARLDTRGPDMVEPDLFIRVARLIV
jgi:hypothetical protein